MIRLECDYATGAHPKILQRLSAWNLEENPGYGLDPHCGRARALLRKLCQAPDADVHFLVGGTQTNTTVIAAALRPWQGVLCAQTGHINIHESGAIESTGHKVLPIPSSDGKLTAGQIEEACQAYREDPTAEHTVQPAMVYLSHPSELGTVYTKAELEAIHAVTRRWGLTLFLDGARLVYGLAASDLTLSDLARLCDVFYLGGTKAGALFGEAVVITQEALKPGFRSLIKQRGGLLAKGWLLGVQFETLLEDGLYEEIGRRAVEQARLLSNAFQAKGCPLLVPTQSNLLFPILPDRVLPTLGEKYSWSFWSKPDPDHTAVRFCTSWSTRDEDLQALIQDLEAL